jgi:hypothetical protein
LVSTGLELAGTLPHVAVNETELNFLLHIRVNTINQLSNGACGSSACKIN